LQTRAGHPYAPRQYAVFVSLYPGHRTYCCSVQRPRYSASYGKLPIYLNSLSAMGPLTLALSRREREQRLLCLQHLLDHRIGFYHVSVYEEGER
jgi:hypothetical protein